MWILSSFFLVGECGLYVIKGIILFFFLRKKGLYFYNAMNQISNFSWEKYLRLVKFPPIKGNCGKLKRKIQNQKI